MTTQKTNFIMFLDYHTDIISNLFISKWIITRDISVAVQPSINFTWTGLA